MPAQHGLGRGQQEVASPVPVEAADARILSAHELARLILVSQLNEFTLYRVFRGV